MLFTFEDISDRFESLLQNFFNSVEKLKSVYDLFFVTIFYPPRYMDIEFLLLAQAIESFHRNVDRNEYVSKADFKILYDDFKNVINKKVRDEDFRQSLKGKLQYVNEFSLRKRLKLLLDDPDGFWADCLNNLVENKKQFIENIVCTRNYLTHYTRDPKCEHNIIKGKDFVRFNERLRIFLLILLLNQIGISKGEISEKIKKYRLFSHLKQQASP